MNNRPIKTIVPDEIYTDRQEFIDLFYKLAINASGVQWRHQKSLGAYQKTTDSSVYQKRFE